MLRTLAAAAILGSTLTGAAAAAPFAETFTELADFKAGPERTFLESLDYNRGTIALPGGFAKIEISDSYYFLDSKDAAKVLTDAWENPPDEAPPLGMIFPAGLTPYHAEAWAVEISWDDIGYVSDEDAGDIDYDDLLETMRDDTREQSQWRVENGYESVELVGWAAQPYYDSAERKLHWAKEVEFGGDVERHTLNYNMRVLGRRGVLVMNFIADMDQLGVVESAIPDVLAMASFEDGARYADFDPSIDTVAAVGIGGLIAGKVLTKAGLLAMALIFLKKGWIIVVLALGALWRLLSRRSRS